MLASMAMAHWIKVLTLAATLILLVTALASCKSDATSPEAAPAAAEIRAEIPAEGAAQQPDPGLTDPGLTDPGLTDPGLTDPGLTEAPTEGTGGGKTPDAGTAKIAKEPGTRSVPPGSLWKTLEEQTNNPPNNPPNNPATSLDVERILSNVDQAMNGVESARLEINMTAEMEIELPDELPDELPPGVKRKLPPGEPSPSLLMDPLTIAITMDMSGEYQAPDRTRFDPVFPIWLK